MIENLSLRYSRVGLTTKKKTDFQTLSRLRDNKEGFYIPKISSFDNIFENSLLSFCISQPPITDS